MRGLERWTTFRLEAVCCKTNKKVSGLHCCLSCGVRSLKLLLVYCSDLLVERTPSPSSHGISLRVQRLMSGCWCAVLKMPGQGFLSGYPNLPHNELHQDWQSRFNFGLRFFFKVRTETRESKRNNGPTRDGFRDELEVTPYDVLVFSSGVSKAVLFLSMPTPSLPSPPAIKRLQELSILLEATVQRRVCVLRHRKKACYS